ncbi:hypothetical protein HYT74_02685 [Candidatus Daviesbacteria bacterium]|nr:hypothetical protein [Candidatus Daviesbacteria bacterium]
MSEVPSPEQSPKPSELSRGQGQVLAAISDGLGNALAVYQGDKELREAGFIKGVPPEEESQATLFTALGELKMKATAAEMILQKGQPLPIIIEGGKEMVDFKYHDWNLQEQQN